MAVVAFEPGDAAGFGQDSMPNIVLGPPRGGGDRNGSLDVLSLGVGGEIVLELGSEAIDGPGSDLLIFENPFRFGGTMMFTEPATVSVSLDGEVFVDFPCDFEQPPYAGCAGLMPVHANADQNDLDPTRSDESGGDAFDLASIGVDRARFVRIRDSGVERGFTAAGQGGFDLDAIAVVSR